MWEPLQILAGLAVTTAGLVIVRGRRGRARRAGFGFALLRFLRGFVGVLIVLIGLSVGFEGTPYMSANICLDITEDSEWCFGGGSEEADEVTDDAALLDSDPATDAPNEED